MPTETWREHVARRERCLEVREKLAAGEIQQINDLITYNLDIRQFAQDAITTCEGPELLRAFYTRLAGRVPEKSNEHIEPGISILDPTCGSGAFLFAALNILEPLYEACLTRMRAFVDDMDNSGEPHSPQKYADFRRILADVERHPNTRYFILKSIIVNNLYGVDIMEEAVEICKLRLFLKLVAQVDKVKELEPLPDIDFNIRAGNTLVGFAAVDDVERTLDETLGFDKDQVAGIVEDAEIVERSFEKFHEIQTRYHMDAEEFASAKIQLRTRLRGLAEKLDRYLAKHYGIELRDAEAYKHWKASHEPFHWFAEFYGIMSRGGFDVVVGNPPYLERSKLGDLYRVVGYRTSNCKDIYSWVVERSFSLRHAAGRLGLIIPVSIASSGSFDVVRDLVNQKAKYLWMSHFANRPGQLFVGAQNRLTILITGTSGNRSQAFATRYHRWDARHGGRDCLFASLQYAALDELTRKYHGLYPKIGTPEAASFLRKALCQRTVSDSAAPRSKYALYWVRVPGYFCQFFLKPPKARPENGGAERIRGEVNMIHLSDPATQRILHAILNSSIYYQFFSIYTDCRHINPSNVLEFPVDLHQLSEADKTNLVSLSEKLEQAMKSNTSLWRKSGLLIESVDSRPSKTVLDEIDRVLSRALGLKEEEYEFIINYDYKICLGSDYVGFDGDQ